MLRDALSFGMEKCVLLVKANSVKIDGGHDTEYGMEMCLRELPASSYAEAISISVLHLIACVHVQVLSRRSWLKISFESISHCCCSLRHVETLKWDRRQDRNGDMQKQCAIYKECRKIMICMKLHVHSQCPVSLEEWKGVVLVQELACFGANIRGKSQKYSTKYSM
uniref:AlNc14C267G9910 protein n=1 Tax=Albugo laibachii Nc14 TaxID=890382 RepID=F0WU89_9STRA|nr:AlNc14C267G9910 [Albugo laibachii Nc14]|eukprot:CCA24967.1 AlNc14C267G9910 [Albugo laibachii Nc14]